MIQLGWEPVKSRAASVPKSKTADVDQVLSPIAKCCCIACLAGPESESDGEGEGEEEDGEDDKDADDDTGSWHLWQCLIDMRLVHSFFHPSSDHFNQSVDEIMLDKNKAGNDLNKVHDGKKGYTSLTDQIYKSVSTFRADATASRDADAREKGLNTTTTTTNVVTSTGNNGVGDVEHFAEACVMFLCAASI